MEQNVDSDISFFAELTLFTGLEGEEILRLIELSELQKYEAGEAIVTEGSEGDAIFILYEGEISVCTQNDKEQTIVLANVSDRGAFFGEVAAVDPGPRSATVVADTRASLLVLSLDALEQFYGEFAQARFIVLRNIARVLARRLRNANVQFALFSSS
jgi:CRP-like cAMP-binding protein